MVSAVDRLSYSARVKLRPCSAVRYRCLCLSLVSCSVLTLVYIFSDLLIRLLSPNYHTCILKSTLCNSPKTPGCGLIQLPFKYNGIYTYLAEWLHNILCEFNGHIKHENGYL